MAVGLAFLLSAALTAIVLPGLIQRLLRQRRLDVPNERSSHDIPVPRGAGIAVIIGALLGGVLTSAVVSLGDVRVPSSALVVVAGSMVLGLLGVREDQSPLPVRSRLGVQVATGVLGALGLGLMERGSDWPSPMLRDVVDFALIAILVVGLCNVVNFMDGINGISGVQTIAAGGLFTVFGLQTDQISLQIAGAALAGSAVGFLPFNVPKAKIFLGDSGSYFLGGAFAFVIALGYRRGLDPCVLVSPLTLYLADSGWTLIRRAARGARVTEPHREHAYQLLVQLGWSHTATSATVGAFMAAHVVIAIVTRTAALPVRLAGAVAVAASLVVYLRIPRAVAGRGRSATSSPSNPA